MNYWLVKTEPDEYSWEDFTSSGGGRWDGVRNYQARNFMQEMKEGDRVFFYHSGSPRAIVGLAKVSKEAYPDPSADSDKWVSVDLVPDRALDNPVSLDAVKADERLAESYLVKNSRLSVMPFEKEQFEIILSKEKEQ